MDIKTADKLLKEGKKVLYNGKAYILKELIIWYDIYKERRCSLFIKELNTNTHYRVDIKQCEEIT